MYKRYIALLSIIVCMGVQAQEYNSLHKEVYRLMTEQKQQAQNHVIDYQLGKLSAILAQHEHPIRDYSDLQTQLYNIYLFYGNCLHYAKGKNLREEEYLELPHKARYITYEELEAALNQRIEEAKREKALSTQLYEAYHTLYNHYERCRSLYAQFAETYPREKNAHLLLSEESMETLHQLSQMTDSVRIDIARYEEALKTYPIEGYQPHFTWQEIKLYRIDGLTKTDLLLNEIDLWDYQQWVNHFLDEQAHLYKDYYAAITQELKDNVSEESLLNTINRLDYGSFMYSWVYLRREQRTLQLATRDNQWQMNPNDYLPFVLSEVQKHYERLEKMEQVYNELQTQVTQSELNKYAAILEPLQKNGSQLVLNDAQLALRTAQAAYGKICRLIVSQTEMAQARFEAYYNEFTGEHIDLELIERLGIDKEGTVVVVVPIGNRYMAITDSHKAILFDSKTTYGTAKQIAGKSTILSAYKLNANTIAVIENDKITYIDNKGNKK